MALEMYALSKSIQNFNTVLCGHTLLMLLAYSTCKGLIANKPDDTEVLEDRQEHSGVALVSHSTEWNALYRAGGQRTLH